MQDLEVWERGIPGKEKTMWEDRLTNHSVTFNGCNQKDSYE